MKISLIHNQYKRNPYVKQSIGLGIRALEDANVDYEYIIFNDNGDKEILEDVEEFLTNDGIKYVYSDVNFGKKKCSGGWVGAQPYVSGDLIHNMGQDDIFTPNFYRIALRNFENKSDLMLIHFNALAVNEELRPTKIMIDPVNTPDYYNHPFDSWKWWFGVGENGKDEVSRANNNFLAPGVIYKRKLHDLIGLPDINNFVGACDFEYWARILFHGYKCLSIVNPTWLYRMSSYSVSNENNNDVNVWINKIKDKYYNLYKERI